MNPLPFINHAYSLVLQEEIQREVCNGNPESQVVFAVQPGNNQYQKPAYGNKDHPLCAHCGILGHTKDKCFKLHRYPPGHKKNSGPQMALVNQVSGPSQGNNSESPLTHQQYQ